MKTPAEFEPIAVWMGWRKLGDHHGEYWAEEIKPGFWDWCKGVEETSLTDAEAVEALRKLSKEDHRKYILEGHPDTDEHHCSIADLDADPFVFYDSGWQPTISAAVEEALLKLIAAEGATQEDRDAEFNRDMDEDLMPGGFN